MNLMMRFHRTVDEAFQYGEVATDMGCRVVSVVPEFSKHTAEWHYWLWLEVPDGLAFDAIDTAVEKARPR